MSRGAGLQGMCVDGQGSAGHISRKHHRGQAIWAGGGRTDRVFADHRLHERRPHAETAQEPAANPRQKRCNPGIPTKAARLVKTPVERIRQTVAQLPVAHYDETGWRVAGKLHWLHCACNEQWRYYTVQEKRGQEGISDIGVMPYASGVAVHDFWKLYQKYDNVDHAMCCAHLERRLVYAHEIGNHAWAKLLRELLQTLCHRRKVLQSEGKEAFPEQELAVYLERYDRLNDEEFAANPIPECTPGKRGPKAKGKFRCLLDCFRGFKDDDILRFARNWRVPYTNNTAERAIRCARGKEKVFGCFRTKSGVDDFARVLSFISSAALHGFYSFDAIVAAFRGDAVEVLFGVD